MLQVSGLLYSLFPFLALFQNTALAPFLILYMLNIQYKYLNLKWYTYHNITNIFFLKCENLSHLK